MPRRQFLDDLDKARASLLPLGIAGVKAGGDDGQVEFSFLGAPKPLATGPVAITAMITDLGEYPSSHEYMIFGGENAPRDISNALGSVRGTNRKTVFEMLDIVSSTLCRVQPDRDGDSQMLEEEDDDEYADEDDDEGDVYDSDYDIFDDVAPSHDPVSIATIVQSTSARSFRQRVREDLRTTKANGFKVGHLSHLLAGSSSYVAVSIRIAKLGISEEAMQAWQLESTDYLTLLIQYPNGYKTNEEIQAFTSNRVTPNLAMRVVAGRRPKPTLQEAIKAFTNARQSERNSISTLELPSAEKNDSDDSSIRDTFISKPLNALLQERFVAVLRSRNMGMGWAGAERWYHEKLSAARSANCNDVVPDYCYLSEEVSDALPEIVRADHYTETGTARLSFPLLAMQFVLRHFVRCTEFCLVCHRKLESDVEAIKPYVCDSELCLFQYMAIGLGPSIEHEMVAQPYVVDLLVSFCYHSAAARKLKEFPDGLSLTVPPVDTTKYNPFGADRLFVSYNRTDVKATEINTSKNFPIWHVGYDRDRHELIFFDKPDECPIRRGDWILLHNTAAEDHDLHCRISDATHFPTITIDPPVVVPRQQNVAIGTHGTLGALHTPKAMPAETRPVSPTKNDSQWVSATFQVYAQDFSSLDAQGKCLAICQLLDTLPTVTEMKQYLVKRHPANLQSWTGRISSSALSLLRWIIASNRSCIMQVDGDSPASSDGTETTSRAPTVFGQTQERCYGMQDYMQFRFAMGAPDKEQRFITEVRNTTTLLNLKHPTIFAWHGSPLANWHMIIREGLHFKNADHGRAYGHGVYHATDAATSTGYCGVRHPTDASIRSSWPSSVLQISSALALNEIVNAPSEFTSQSPYYVVKQLDWIQTRYLFVKVTPTNDAIKIGPEVVPRIPHTQDPQRTPIGMERGSRIIIPASAIKSAWRNASAPSSKKQLPLKKLKLIGGRVVASASVFVDVDDHDDIDSITTDVEDRDLLMDEHEEPTAAPCSNRPSSIKLNGLPPKTGFVPGSLDFDTLPIMPLPTYATPSATRRLMQELRSLQKVQESTPAAEIGWFIDVDKIENAYQWIVELHSFHTFESNGKKLPLAQDMEKQGIKSVVLEVRFNKDFPFTPPYVRVIRPQFLTVAQGGGGHIVMGGSLCMELTTNTGWVSVSTMESVLMQIRMAIASEPHARLAHASGRDYGVAEGAKGYMRACASHGWEVPPGFREMAYNGAQ